MAKSNTGWTPVNNPGTRSSSARGSKYPYFGTLNDKNKLITYGEKPEEGRRPQSSQVMNRATIRQIVSGELKPIEGKHFDVTSLNDDNCPFQADYLAVCEELGVDVAEPVAN